ncbi:endolytic transglycosylase MltG [Arcobacter sp. CECT 8985]|uniref:endolytic transglycosylase MltG n=1 Tax=Arcobacter sp. CECT 8985 TaxID=1935424 RepID=UPI00100AB94F|nr:endolytic transglycosylase MltG [Arcobacter sp. CECT 8985]RXJ87037.1 4-amino-4-deoxychorismate lyase [Arcobacter sp. CECT 8985]
MPENKKKTNVKTKQTSAIKNSFIFFNITEFILVFSIVILYYITIPLSTTNVIFIPKGSTNSIITYLNKSDYELGIIDKIYLKFLGYPQSGWIDIKSNYLTKADFLYKLTTSKAALKNITLIPGETSYIFLNQIAKKMNLSRKELQKIYDEYAYKEDGNILADTYALPYGMKEYHLLFYLFSNTNKQYEDISKKIFGTYNRKRWYYYITLASVIQKEAANESEMSYVSSVIHNRLKKGMKLQMDGTLNYGQYSHVKVTAQRIREDNSSYNTYKKTGLPSSPVCAVSIDAIKAAIFPAKTDYLYFVKNEKTGLHDFSNSYKKHLNNIRKNRIIKRNLNKIRRKKTQENTKETTKKTTPTAHKKEVSVFPKKSATKKSTSIKSLWDNVK